MKKILKFLITTLMAYIFAILLCIPIFNYFLYKTIMENSTWYQKKKRRKEIL